MHLLTYSFIGMMSLLICTACLEDVEDTTIPPPSEEYSFDGGMYMPRDPNQSTGSEGYGYGSGSGGGSGSGSNSKDVSGSGASGGNNKNTESQKENQSEYSSHQLKKFHHPKSIKLPFNRNSHRLNLLPRSHHLELIKPFNIHSIRHSVYSNPQHLRLKLHGK